MATKLFICSAKRQPSLVLQAGIFTCNLTPFFQAHIKVRHTCSHTLVMDVSNLASLTSTMRVCIRTAYSFILKQLAGRDKNKNKKKISEMSRRHFSEKTVSDMLMSICVLLALSFILSSPVVVSLWLSLATTTSWIATLSTTTLIQFLCMIGWSSSMFERPRPRTSRNESVEEKKKRRVIEEESKKESQRDRVVEKEMNGCID